MKVRLVPGPRNEELIQYVHNIFALNRNSEEFFDAYSDLECHIKEPDAFDVMDAAYYASECREAGVADQEMYLTWLMTDEEYWYFLDRMAGIDSCR